MTEITYYEQIKKIILKHEGSNNPISSKAIGSMLGLPKLDGNAVVRKLTLETAERYSLPIAANSKGYFLITNLEELNTYIENLDNRIEAMLNREYLIKRNYEEYFKNDNNKKG